MKKFRGRESELNVLQRKYDSDDFQMVVLYGRGRIGKTELMNEFMRRQSCKCIAFTASEQSKKELPSIMTDTVLNEIAPDMIGMIEFPGFDILFEFIGNKARDEKIVFFIDEYFSFGGYFTEEQVKTVVTSEKQSPALYNSIVSAIATGHTRNSEIASCIGMDDITYPLKMLLKAEIIEKRIAKKPYYVLNDSMLVFWFKYVNRAVSLINVGKGEKYYINSVSNKLHDFMGIVFEKMCKEYLLMKAGEGIYPLITEIDNYQQTVLDDENKHRQIELDLIGKNGKDILVIGECKFKNEKVDKDVFESFLEKSHYIKSKKPLLCMFSLSGYTDYVKNHAGDVLLLTLEDLY